jgi:proteasome lid subunit RPN8/RPN11
MAGMGQPVFEIAEDVEAALFAWARAARPREACGLLLGSPADEGLVVRAVRVDNVADGRDAFELDPAGYVRAEAEARRGGLRVVGVWHSHPDAPPRPAAADLAGALRGASGWLHVIVSAVEGARAPIARYRLSAGRLAPDGPALERRVPRVPRGPSALENAR